ncbi:hypothetical protein TWF696_009929 [Orbilia brochopaga]|uniref:t-SNARE coiled-coil homology domain-containing protein n=1 Tax=Orbilia brochopaga TaxID=3140254 RepID=A0AAV9UYE5_9PEZI
MASNHSSTLFGLRSAYTHTHNRHTRFGRSVGRTSSTPGSVPLVVGRSVYRSAESDGGNERRLIGRAENNRRSGEASEPEPESERAKEREREIAVQSTKSNLQGMAGSIRAIESAVRTADSKHHQRANDHALQAQQRRELQAETGSLRSVEASCALRCD